MMAAEANTRRRSPDEENVKLPAGRDVAVSILFRLHYNSLVRLAWYLVDDRETAEDVVMDAFASLHRRWVFVRHPDDAWSYLRASVINGARSKLRRRRLMRTRDLTGYLPEVASAEHHALASEDARSLVAHVRRLPARQREVIVLRYFSDMSEAQIAETLGISRGAVKSHASRALTTLTAAMEVAQ